MIIKSHYSTDGSEQKRSPKTYEETRNKHHSLARNN